MKLILFFVFFSFISHPLLAKQRIRLNNYYKSEVDQLISIKSFGVLRFSDNAKGIYAKPFEAFVKNYFEQSPKWQLKVIKGNNKPYNPLDLESTPVEIREVRKSSNVDAVISGRATRSENGLNIYLSLFLTKDGLLFAKEAKTNIPSSELSTTGANPFKTLLEKVLAQLPYDGTILSRNDKLVTLNLSKADGIRDGQTLTVAQIIKIERHPKFNFIMSNEKAILGQLRVTKADDSLSFAEIIVEKEKGSIQKGAKIVGSKFIDYNNPILSSAGHSGNSGSFGGATRADRWRPVPPPSFGKIEASFGIGQYKATSGPRNSDTYFYPSIALAGEVWVNDQWSVHGRTKQGIVSLEDPLGGSDLSIATASYELMGGYNFRSGGAYDTKIEILAGYFSYKSTIDDATPFRFTTTKYSGIKLGADVQVPIIERNEALAGASIFMLLRPRLKENPGPSGNSSDNTVTMFKVYGLKKFRENLYFNGSLNYDLYSTSFNSTITSSGLSQRHLTFNLGVNYYF